MALKLKIKSMHDFSYFEFKPQLLFNCGQEKTKIAMKSDTKLRKTDIVQWLLHLTAKVKD